MSQSIIEKLQADNLALTAENAVLKARTPFAYSYRYAGCETCEGFQDWRWKLSKERPPEWMLETGKVTSLIAIGDIEAAGGIVQASDTGKDCE